MVRRYARALDGVRAYGCYNSHRGQNVSVVGALGLQGIIAQWSGLGSIDRLTFEAFISQKLVPKLWKGAIVVMDNCSIHKGEVIGKMIQDAGATLIYLSPYSPDFSPIENCWSKIKSILRKISARTYPELLKALEGAFSQILDQDILGWFTHCCYCTSVDW